MSAVPILRFKEFSAPLKSVVLNDIADIKRGAGSQYIDYAKDEHEGIRLIRIGDFLSSEPVYVFTTEAIQRFTLEIGDILIAGTGATAGIVFEVPDVFSGMAYSYNAPRIRPNNVETGYFLNYLKTPSLEKQKRRLFTGNAQPFLDTTDIRNFKFFIPTSSEQKKIAGFLGAVDYKIAGLRERERLLTQYKKGVMQKIFTQTLRFKADDGSDFPDWEERALSDVYEWIRTNSLSRANLNYEIGEVKNIHYGDVHTKFSKNFKQDKEDVPFITSSSKSDFSEDEFCKLGDVVFADASEDYNDIGKAIEVVELGALPLVAGLHTYIARPRQNSVAIGFSAYLFQSWSLRYEIMRIAQGISVLGVSKTNMEKIGFQMPHPDEQQKITDFLSAIDDKITTVSAQVTQMQTFKKGLLQKMFV